MVARYLPFVGMILFLGVGLFWRAWLHYRRHGHSGIIIFQSAGWQQLGGAVFFLLLLVLTIQALVVAVAPELLSGLQIVAMPPAAVWLGAVLLLGGLLLLVAAQLGLGSSWRVGIEEGARPGLVTDGLYRFCRNPIFLGMFVVMAGLTVLVPTWLSLVFLLGGILGTRSQTLEEEDYLLRTYGDSYRIYAAKVGRFLPGLGRLREVY